MSIFIDDYVSGENSVCREKRQYTAMLYGVLCGTSKVKLTLETFENKNYEVHQAFYEPAFLRDYFNEFDNKASFNKKLVAFANTKLKEIIKLCGKKRGKMNPPDVKVEKVSEEKLAGIKDSEEIYNLAANIDKAGEDIDLAKHINAWGKSEKAFRNPLARWMMNVKPDIALLLKRKGVKRGEYRLHFLDLEYLAGPEGYPAYIGCYDKAGEELTECYHILLSKRLICDFVIEFLCEELKKREADDKDSACAAGFTSVSVFVGDKNKEAEGISLSKLCEHSRKAYLGEKVKEPRLLLGDTIGLSI